MLILCDDNTGIYLQEPHCNFSKSSGAQFARSLAGWLVPLHHNLVFLLTFINYDLENLTLANIFMG